MCPKKLLLGALSIALFGGCDSNSQDPFADGHFHPAPGGDPSAVVTASALPGADCREGAAAGYPCLNIDMPGGLDFSVEASDIWGWEDAVNGDEYAILGLTTGTAFIRITDPSAPQFVGFLPSATYASSLRDIKVLNDHAVIVSEAPHHGLQILDLSVLAGLTETTLLSADTHYTSFGSAHNVAVNAGSNFMYVLGSDTCAGGLHMVDMTNPQSPQFAGCYADDGYTHDVQCVIYAGADVDYLGREVCFASNEDTLTILDVTDKSAPELIARAGYAGASYTHQGWLSEDQRYFFLGDEMDEQFFGHNTRTYIWDLSDLDRPQQTFEYTASTAAVDHNLYVLNDHIYQANYEAGVRILRTGNLAQGEVAEVAFFDTVPGSDNTDFEGVWSVFPFFSSGLIVTANISGELFVLQPQLDSVARCADGLDNDGDGGTDYPSDGECSSEVGNSEQ